MRSEKIGYYFKSPENSFDDFDWDAHVVAPEESEEEQATTLDSLVAEARGVDTAAVDAHVENRMNQVLAESGVPATMPVIPVAELGSTRAEDGSQTGENGTDDDEEVPGSLEINLSDTLTDTEEGSDMAGENQAEEQQDIQPIILPGIEHDEPVVTPITTVTPPPAPPTPAAPTVRNRRPQGRANRDELPDVQSPNWGEYDDFARDSFEEIDGFLIRPEEVERTIKGAVVRRVEKADLEIAEGVLLHVGYSQDEIDALDKKDAVYLAKAWVYTRRSGGQSLFSTDKNEIEGVVIKLKRLTSPKVKLPDATRDGLKTDIRDATGMDHEQLERVINCGLLVEDGRKNIIIPHFRDAIVMRGTLVDGSVSNHLRVGVTVGELETVPGLNISRMLAFVRAAGVKVDGSTTWEDLLDKKNIILLQLLINEKDAKRLVLALNPRERNLRCIELMRVARDAFVSPQGTKLDPTKFEIRVMAEEFMKRFAPNIPRNRNAFVQDYIGWYREFLKNPPHNVKFLNENMDRPQPEKKIYEGGELNKMKWEELAEMYLNREKGTQGSFQAVRYNQFGWAVGMDDAIKQAFEAGKITEEQRELLHKERAAAINVMRLQQLMFAATEINDPMITEAGKLDTDGGFKTLLEMNIPGIQTTGGQPVRIMNLVTYWDRIMRDGQKNDEFLNIWDKNVLAGVAERFGGNVVAAKLARDIYFMTGGAARYEVTKGRGKLENGRFVPDATRGHVAQDQGVFKEVMNFPLDFSLPDNKAIKLEEHRKVLRDGFGNHPGVDLRIVSFWDEMVPEGEEDKAKNRWNQSRVGGNHQEPFTDYAPLSATIIQRRTQGYTQTKFRGVKKWLEDVKAAQAAMKAEKDFMRADEDQRVAKFKELTGVYGYLGPKDSKAVLAQRAWCHLEYVRLRNKVKHSTVNTTQKNILDLYITPLENKLPPEEFEALVREYYRRGWATGPRIDQKPELVAKAEKREMRKEMAGAFVRELLKGLFSGLKF